MIGERLKKRTFDMNKEEHIAKANANKNAKKYPCGVKTVEEKITAANLVKQAVCARKQNG